MLFAAPVVSLKHHLFLSRCPCRHTRRLTASRSGENETTAKRQTFLDEAARDFAEGMVATEFIDETRLVQASRQD